jgi:hypothetical protein
MPARSARRQKRRGKTPLDPQSLIGPGFRGLNTEETSVIGFSDPTWALVLQNAVFDDNGRIAGRKGWVDQTTTPVTGTPDMWVVEEYLREDGTRSLVAKASDHTFQASTDDGATFTDITGSVVTTSNAWKFVNATDEIYAVAPGHKVHRYTGTGNLTEIASSPVTNGTILSAFGRIWVGVDATGQIKYSGLLDGTDWTSSQSGTIDLSNVWTQGTDNIKGLAAFGATLVVFGTKHIVLYVDGAGSTLAVDPDSLYVVDTIEGTGLLHRDSVVNIGEGDLWFISKQGVQSLNRVISDKTNPLVDVTAHVRSLVKQLDTTHVGSAGEVKGIFSPENKFVLYMYPESDKVLVIDTKFQMEDGTYRVAEWTGLDSMHTLAVRDNGDILYGGTAGDIHRYEGHRDDGGGANTVYDIVYASPWLDFGQHERLKILKGFYMVFYGRETLTATARWAVDYRPLEFTETFTNDYSPSGGEWGIGEFGEDEFGDGARLRRAFVAGGGEGLVVKLWVTMQSTDVDDVFAIQEVGAFAKLGAVR